MPVKVLPPLPKARRFAEFVGTVITITPEPLKHVATPYGQSSLGTLDNGEKVWIPSPQVAKFEGTHAGRYEVYSYQAYGKTCYGLKNAE